MHGAGLRPPQRFEHAGAGGCAEQLGGEVAGDAAGVHLVLGPDCEGDHRVKVRAAAASDGADGEQAAGASEQQPGRQRPR